MSRLFWKILFGFWLTHGAITIGLSLWFAVLRETPPHERMLVAVQAQVSQDVTLAAAAALRAGGPAAIDDLRATLPPDERDALSVDAVAADTPSPPHGAVVRAPDGTTYLLRYRPLWASTAATRDPGPPRELIILLIVGGLLYSVALAWYLTAPLQRLRRAFDLFGAGNLAVRAGSDIGGRRDEIADLSREFDDMAGRIAQLVRSRERLLHDVSHELRSPLARLHVAVGLARQDPGRTELSLDRIEREAARLNDLVGELLTLARIEHGGLARADRIDLQALCAEVVEDAAFEASGQGVRIRLIDHTAADGGAPALSGNRELMRRAIENVVRNALHVSRRGEQIDVDFSLERGDGDGAADPPRRYRIVVADRGPGVDDATLQTMFEPFVQAHSATGGGFGLGLAITRRAVAAHGGTATARNRPEGGLEVDIALPVQAA